MSIGTAVIGCGKVGHTHAQALKGIDESKLVAVFDLNEKRAQEFADQYGVQPYSDLGFFLQNEKIKMVSICTPHPTHPELAIRCAQAGKHILVEKPLAVDLHSCEKMLNAAQTAGVKLSVVSQRRFYEPVERVKRAIQAGKIGKPILATLTVLGWRDKSYYQSDPWRGKWEAEGGGVLVNQTSHQLDLLQWLMGPIEELFGYWGNLNHPEIEVEDTAVAVLRFKNGALGNIIVSNSQKPGFYGKIHIHGETGASVGVQTDGGSPFIAGVSKAVEPPINDIWTIPGEESLLPKWQEEDIKRSQQLDIMTHYHEVQIRDFILAVIEGREPAVSAKEAKKHVELFVAIYRSQRDGKPVRFPPSSKFGSEQFDGRLAR